MLLLEKNFCQTSAGLWQLVGKVLLVFKIVIPLLLIIFGMIDLGKAVVASDEKAIKTATNSIIKRLIAAVVIFFIPTMVAAIFSLISDFKDEKEYEGYSVCSACINRPNGDVCTGWAKDLKDIDDPTEDQIKTATKQS